MVRFLVSLILGVGFGIGAGLVLGWGVFPREYTEGTLPELARQHSDEYTVMIAAGYVADGDIQGALERLNLLGVDNSPAHVQEVTERYITNSRDIQDIQLLVALSEGFGRLTPIMEPYRQVELPEVDS